MHGGYKVCRNNFTFYMGLANVKSKTSGTIIMMKGFPPESMAIQESMLSDFRQFWGYCSSSKITYAEQHAIFLPGRIPGFKQDDFKVLPSSDTKKVQTYHNLSLKSNNLHFY